MSMLCKEFEKVGGAFLHENEKTAIIFSPQVSDMFATSIISESLIEYNATIQRFICNDVMNAIRKYSKVRNKGQTTNQTKSQT